MRVLPLFVLSIEINFFQSGVTTTTHLVSGFSEHERLLVEDVVFPHRGEWKIKDITLRLSDLLGATSFAWTTGETGLPTICVFPPPQFESALPVMSSAVRAGDALADLVERQGDPFDIKAYHPADGMKRILWKVFAKRGELVARHPERAVTPEGQVLCFIAARPDDDYVCSAAVAYARVLTGLDLQLWASSEGALNHPAARTPEALEELLVDTAWAAGSSTQSSTAQELRGLLSQVQGQVQHSRIENMVVFVGSSRIATSSGLADMGAALDTLAHMNVTPIVVIVRDEKWIPKDLAERRFSRVRRLLWSEPISPLTTDPKLEKQFLQQCAMRGWEVIL